MGINIFLTTLTLIWSVNSGSYALYNGGNSWTLDGGYVGGTGYEFYSLPAKFVSFFYTTSVTTAAISIKMACNVSSTVSVSLGSTTINSSTIAASAINQKTSVIGNFKTSVGYNRIYVTIKGTKNVGKGLVSTLIINGTFANLTYVKDNIDSGFYWGRRGTSAHIWPDYNETNITYFYSEVFVPKGYDMIGSYFMANGFGQGYFGIQVNSQTQRRVLFSVWSGYDAQIASEVPKEWTVLLNKSGPGVTIRTFEGQGTGGQSYLIFPWKANTTYKFLTKVEPLKTNGTTYTAWFHDPNNGTTGGWRLIASWTRPKIQTYMTSIYSFLEGYFPSTGNMTKMAYYGNQWVYGASKKWIESTNMEVTRDSSPSNYRIDVDGGVFAGNRYFLKNGGFFSTVVLPSYFFLVCLSIYATNKTFFNIRLFAYSLEYNREERYSFQPNCNKISSQSDIFSTPMIYPSFITFIVKRPFFVESIISLQSVTTDSQKERLLNDRQVGINVHPMNLPNLTNKLAKVLLYFLKKNEQVIKMEINTVLTRFIRKRISLKSQQ